MGKEADGSKMVKRFSSKHGCKIFSAISTVLYASISIAKVDEVENLILRKGTSLPIGIFDLQEWAPYLDMARRCRSLALNEGNDKQFDEITFPENYGDITQEMEQINEVNQNVCPPVCHLLNNEEECY